MDVDKFNDYCDKIMGCLKPIGDIMCDSDLTKYFDFFEEYVKEFQDLISQFNYDKIDRHLEKFIYEIDKELSKCGCCRKHIGKFKIINSGLSIKYTWEEIKELGRYNDDNYYYQEFSAFRDETIDEYLSAQK